MNFPIIKTFKDMEPILKSNPEFGILKQENGFQTISYFIASSESFNTPLARECRGITFDRSGNIASRSLHKFFNVGERPETLIENVNWSNVRRVMDKRDGSMINPVLVDGKVLLKTKRSFLSDVAKQAQTFFDTQPDLIKFSRVMLETGWSPTYEYTSPSNRIVLSYDQDELTLLHLRNNWTGQYAAHEVLADLSETYNVPLVHAYDVQDIDSFLSSYKDVSGVEGWVIQFEDGDMVKLKTEEYTKHHRMITFVRERDVAELILDEKIDDVKAAFIERGLNLEKMLDVEKRVVSMLNDMREEVESIHDLYKEYSRKDFAIKFSGHRYFGLLMKKFTGTEPDYVSFFKDKLLKQEFSLISV